MAASYLVINNKKDMIWGFCNNFSWLWNNRIIFISENISLKVRNENIFVKVDN